MLSFKNKLMNCGRLLFLFVFSCTDVFSTGETFLLINGGTSEIILEFGPDIDTQASPCSTFKLPLSLMGYDSEILKNQTIPTWSFQEGYDDWLMLWKMDQTPESWMKYSCVWYSKILSLHLRLERIQNYLLSMGYGNQALPEVLVEPGPLNPFWINSSLKISPKEQVDFIQKMLSGKLPISSKSVQMTKTLLFKEELSEGWRLFGKTGWSGSEMTREALQHAWFIGWIEKDSNFFPFAYLIRDKTIHLDQRVPRVKELLGTKQ